MPFYEIEYVVLRRHATRAVIVAKNKQAAMALDGEIIHSQDLGRVSTEGTIPYVIQRIAATHYQTVRCESEMRAVDLVDQLRRAGLRCEQVENNPRAVHIIVTKPGDPK